MIFLTDMNTIANKILARQAAHGAGWVFSSKHLTDLGDRAAIDQALSRLAKDGRMRRLAVGLRFAEDPPCPWSAIAPNLDAVAAAAAEQAGHRIQISPARAANVLGLSSQVPAKAVYLTDGSSRRIKIGNQVVYLSTRVRVPCSAPAPRPAPHFRHESNWQRSRKRRCCTATPFHPSVRYQTRPSQVDAPSSRNGRRRSSPQSLHR